ncbi:MAG: halocarboxylic acid dehydrogenase DehI family protein [Gemmatimonadota bacterium]
MLGLGRSGPVAEHEASGETERVYHEVRQTLRVTGVNLIFRTWAASGRLLPTVWDALRPSLETRAFEDAADRLRAEAVRAGDTLGRVGAPAHARLGQSQAAQVRDALDLYRYVTPKLLLLASAVRLALDGEAPARPGAGGDERILPGVPGRMYPMEMVPEEPDEDRIRDLFRDIRETLGLDRVNSVYRTLALWPDYLEPAWRGLKPLTGAAGYREAADLLRERSRELAGGLPQPVPLSREQVKEAGEDADELVRTTEKFEGLIPGVVLNVVLFALDWDGAEALARSPFPAPARASAPGGAA